MSVAFILLYGGTFIIFMLVALIQYHYSYWHRRGVPYDIPTWGYGNLYEFGRTVPLFKPFRDFYLKHRKSGAPYGGFYGILVHKVAIVLDLDLARNVLVRDFGNFTNRGNYYNARDDPLSAHLFNLDGAEWRHMRAKLTPTFTLAKMKHMVPDIVRIAEHLVMITKQQVDAYKALRLPLALIEIREYLARYTTDVIGCCAFGLNCNSLVDPSTDFRTMGRQAFAKRRHGRLVNAFLQFCPNLARRLGIKIVHSNVAEFFQRIVRETVQYRDTHNVQRNDFMNLLMGLRADGLTLDQIAAQSFVFFLAGFETSSSAVGFTLFELARNLRIQARARAEVLDVLARYNGEISYEAIKELKYLQCIFYESLRMYSIAPLAARVAIADYKIANTNYIIEAGTTVYVPIDGIHYDPDIYPNPEVFDPERFTPEQCAKRHPMAWLPFGAGPRNCIGLRFGELQSIICLAVLLKHFNFNLSEHTPAPLKFKMNTLVLTPENGIILSVGVIDDGDGVGDVGDVDFV